MRCGHRVPAHSGVWRENFYAALVLFFGAVSSVAAAFVFASLPPARFLHRFLFVFLRTFARLPDFFAPRHHFIDLAGAHSRGREQHPGQQLRIRCHSTVGPDAPITSTAMAQRPGRSCSLAVVAPGLPWAAWICASSATSVSPSASPLEAYHFGGGGSSPRYAGPFGRRGSPRSIRPRQSRRHNTPPAKLVR